MIKIPANRPVYEGEILFSLFGFKPSPIPMKSFTNAEEAKVLVEAIIAQ